MRFFRSFMVFFIILQLVLGSWHLPVEANGSGNGNGNGNTPNTPSLGIAAEAAQRDIPLPADGPAQGAINLTVLPQGTVTNATRDPIDVVFVFDKSGSMKEKAGSKTKLKLAQTAMGEAVKLFSGVNSEGRNLGDRFALVPFSSEDETESKTYGLTNNLEYLYQKALALDADGGTNYTVALEKARQILNDSQRRKYIIFLTDGMPTFSKKNLLIDNAERLVYFKLFDSARPYTTQKYYYKNGTSQKVYLENNVSYRPSDDTVYNAVKSEIRSHGIDAAQALSKANIKLYAIGFGDIDGAQKEVDLDYLRKLSELTGGTAEHGRADNLNSVFRSITDDINRLVLGQVKFKVNLSKYNGKVRLAPNANAYMDGDYAVMNLNDVPYTVGGATPSPQSYMLPLEFLEKGTYNFNNSDDNSGKDMYLEYVNLQGETVRVYPGHVQFKVRDRVPPSYQVTMSYLDNVSELEKWPPNDGRTRDTFRIRYTVKAVGDVNGNGNGNGHGSPSGKLSNGKLVQQLPKGVKLLSINGVPVSPGTGSPVEISLQEVEYSKISSAPEQIFTLEVQVEWALNERLQNPEVYYTDDESAKKTTFEAPKDPVRLKVKLPDARGYTYEANELGQIRKLLNADNTMADSVTLVQDDREITLPVKSMLFKPGNSNRIIAVTYRDVEGERDVTAELPLVPDVLMKEKESGEQLADRTWTNEAVEISLTRLVPDSGSHVVYQYRLTGDGTREDWQTLSAPYRFDLDADGKYTIEVKATGGFATGEIVSREAWIDRTPPAITILSPEDRAVLDADRVTISGKVTEPYLDWLKLTGANDLPADETIPVNTDGSFSYQASLAAGENDFTFTARDLAGNKRSVTLTVIKEGGTTRFSLYYDADGTNPVPEEKYGEWFGQTVYAKLDFPAGLPKEYLLDGSKHPYTGLIEISKEGTTEISYRESSGSGTMITRQIKLDRTGPVVTISGGTPDGPDKQVKDILISAEDPNGSGVKSLTVWDSIGGPSNARTITGSQGTYTTQPTSTGQVTVYAQATDHAGHSTTVEQLFVIDITPPEVHLGDNFIIQLKGDSGNITINANVTDEPGGSGIERVTYEIYKADDQFQFGETADVSGEMYNSGGSQYSANANAGDEPGWYKVTVKAYDRHKNKSNQTVERLVDSHSDVFLVSPGFKLAADPSIDFGQQHYGNDVVSSRPIAISLTKQGASYFTTTLAKPSTEAEKLALGSWFDVNRDGQIGQGDWDWGVKLIEYAIYPEGREPTKDDWIPLKSSQIVITTPDVPWKVAIRITDSNTRWNPSKDAVGVQITKILDGTFTVRPNLKKM
ncbi:VWA domain-containing protein [Brevibacillus sp. SYP-B805]|uniref:VWA domain-containing protein n=1 Tax=Brevibacillus sp. SYP-B805 TaxID=1578199 RepID=UPI0013EA062A|nr:VWA domain-containing protein [Brevibacillus sp. SYP-B805]NGQ94328.1 VWA domain-containing protein [Brevibacillus sp. SYP-B805]